MEYVLEGVDCYLKLSNIRVFENDPAPNTLCRVSVKSGDFSGATDFDINIKSLATFSVQLKEMYETLKGCAGLAETYEPSNIKINASSGGRFTVSGKIVMSYPYHHLEFEYDIDQTMLNDFTLKLYKDYAHYL